MNIFLLLQEKLRLPRAIVAAATATAAAVAVAVAFHVVAFVLVGTATFSHLGRQ